MKINMDRYAESMVGFFDCLCGRVRPQFAEVKEIKRQHHILEVMQEYGFAKYNTDKKIWIATKKLIRKIKTDDNTRDDHKGFAKLFQKGLDRISRESRSNSCHYFQLFFPVIFGTQCKNCIKWMKLDMWLDNNEKRFPSERVRIVKNALLTGVMDICVGETNATLDELARLCEFNEGNNGNDYDAIADQTLRIGRQRQHHNGNGLANKKMA
jgi:hypothetical protein